MSTECSNLCYKSDKTCEYCKKNKIVSTEFYRARRPANNAWVVGYLVKNKEGQIEGILNKANNFSELAWIIPETLELYEENNKKCDTLANSKGDDACECRFIKGYSFLCKTSCDNVFQMQNGFEYCPYCGKKIKIM